MSRASNAVIMLRGGPGLAIADVPPEYSYARIRELLKEPVLLDILSAPGDLPYRGRSVGVYGAADGRNEYNYTASLVLSQDMTTDVLLLKTYDDDEGVTKVIPFTSDDVASLLRFPRNVWISALCGKLDYQLYSPARCRACNLPYGLIPTGERVCACDVSSYL